MVLCLFLNVHTKAIYHFLHVGRGGADAVSELVVFVKDGLYLGARQGLDRPLVGQAARVVGRVVVTRLKQRKKYCFV